MDKAAVRWLVFYLVSSEAVLVRRSRIQARVENSNGYPHSFAKGYTVNNPIRRTEGQICKKV